jgi:hypothetical protein
MRAAIWGHLMKAMILALSAWAALASPAQGADEQQVGKPIGGWRIMGSTDAMTDMKECVAYFGPTESIQMTKDSLAIGYSGRGGLDAYILRFDDNPADEMTLGSERDKRIGFFIIQDPDPNLARVRSSKRLRVRGLTALSTIVDDDIDLTPQAAVLNILNSPACN